MAEHALSLVSQGRYKVAVQREACHAGAMPGPALMIVTTPRLVDAHKVVFRQRRFDQGMCAIYTRIEQTNRWRVSSRPRYALSQVLDEGRNIALQVLGEYRRVVAGAPKLGHTAGCKQQQFDRADPAEHRHYDCLRELEKRVGSAHLQAERFGSGEDTVKSICETPQRPPYFSLRIGRQRFLIVAPERAKPRFPNVLDRLDATSLWRRPVLRRDLAFGVVGDHCLKCLPSIVRNEQRKPANALWRHHLGTLSRFLALPLKNLCTGLRVEFDLKKYPANRLQVRN